MIGISKLLNGTASAGDVLRYGRDSRRLPSRLLQFSADKKPVVVWNSTKRCNLHCAHCYMEAVGRDVPGELSTDEAHRMLADLAAFGVPVVLFSGGEPLVRPDIFELMRRCRELGMRAVLSSNGTLITPAVAERIREIGVSYVGVSLDGLEAVHDKFRGQKGAFQATLAGIRNLKAVGVKVGLRVTLTRFNAHQLDALFDLLEAEDIPRVCVYHLAYAGRGGRLMAHDLTHEETRAALETICRRAEDFHRRGIDKEILTVDNHADAVYVYLRLRERDPERAAEVLQLLRWNGGNNSGVAIGAIDWFGNVYPDQFWRSRPLGNVRERPFSEIWGRPEPGGLLAQLRDRKPLLKGRCAACRWLDVCNGNLRVRAETATGDPWAEDPACYLSDAEIGREGDAGVRA